MSSQEIFKRFDEAKFKIDLINAPWPSVDEFQDVNYAWTAWSNVFLRVIDEHAPCRTIQVRNKPAPWLNSNIKQMMFKRDWLKKKVTRPRSTEDWAG